MKMFGLMRFTIIRSSLYEMVNFHLLDSIMVWAQSALIMKKCYTKTDEGKDNFQLWHDDTSDFNDNMKSDHPDSAAALKEFMVADVTFFWAVAFNYVEDAKCKEWFNRTSTEFGSILRDMSAGKATDLDANKYMKNTYLKIQEECPACDGISYN